MPRTFVAYQCQRSLVCCRAPVRAPLNDSHLPLVHDRLKAGDDEARRIAETLEERLELVPHITRESRLWRQPDGACVNLDLPARACILHRSAGLGALPPGCRNFPRWVTTLPDRVEVAFNLTCPTASRMLAEDTEPFALVPVDDASTPYTSTAVASPTPAWDGKDTAPLERVLSLREAWWQTLAAARNDPERLLRALDAMLVDPLGGGSAPTAEAEPLHPVHAQHALVALERTKVRGDHYRSERYRALDELAAAPGRAALTAALAPAPDLLAAYASCGVQWIGVHDPRPVSEVLRLTARRTLLAARLADTFCTLAPYPLTTLFADAFAAAFFVDA